MSGSKNPASGRQTRKIQSNRNRRSRRRTRKNTVGKFFSFLFLCFVTAVLIAGSVLYIKKYAPTSERMDLTEYYTYLHEDEAALVINDTYTEPGEDDICGSAIIRDDRLYIKREVLKSCIDDGYVFDDTESVLRYTTDADVVNTPYNSCDYSINDQAQSWEVPVILSAYDSVFVDCDWAKQFSDFSYTLASDPYRASIYVAGFTHNTSALRHKAAIRRLGGPKSKILKIGKRGERVSVIKKHGKWTEVATEDGITGFVRNRLLGPSSKTTVEATLPPGNYNHKLIDKKLMVAWHMTTSSVSNKGLKNFLTPDVDIDVICPTWYHLIDNDGGIYDNASREYVDICHERGILVWGLASDIENSSIDVKTILGRTSCRDRLIKNLINSALSNDLDGFNIDFEHIPLEVADGYIEFIKELSLLCEKNDLFLSVDNYVPAAFNEYYNRRVQADYADYIMVMAYDEYFSGGDEPGSVASLPFVEEGVKNTLKEVPAEQTIQGIPLFCREWIETADKLYSNSMGMDEVAGYLSKNSLTPEWDEDLGQYYTEFTKDDAKHMLWIEDPRSLELKMNVMRDNGLGGAAFWRLGYDTDEAWAVISKYE